MCERRHWGCQVVIPSAAKGARVAAARDAGSLEIRPHLVWFIVKSRLVTILDPDLWTGDEGTDAAYHGNKGQVLGHELRRRYKTALRARRVSPIAERRATTD